MEPESSLPYSLAPVTVQIQVAIKWAILQTDSLRVRWGGGKCNHLFCVRSLLTFSYDGQVDRYTAWICYQGVLQKCNYFRESPCLFGRYFEFHHSDPVLLAGAIKK